MLLSLSVPLIPDAYADYTPATLGQRLERRDNMVEKYGTQIAQSVKLNNIPEALLLGTLLIENEDAVPGILSPAGAVGLGQIKPLTAMDMISLASRKKFLTDAKKAVLRRRLGSNLDTLAKVDDVTKVISSSAMTAHLKDPEFNVMLAGIILSMLMAEHTGNGTYRPDYISARYNQGYYLLKARKIDKDLPIAQLIAKVPTEAKRYIVKMCGRSGWLEILS
jgi:soluble lytic murein transglycosylase-like protein